MRLGVVRPLGFRGFALLFDGFADFFRPAAFVPLALPLAGLGTDLRADVDFGLDAGFAAVLVTDSLAADIVAGDVLLRALDSGPASGGLASGGLAGFRWSA